MEPTNGPAQLRIVALEDNTIFYLDAATLTYSSEAQPYSPEMGPRALWYAAANLLITEGGIQPDALLT